jgi:hypothetical protein
MPRRQHPTWFDHHAAYDQDELKFAVALGRGVGLTSGRKWADVEGVLQELWNDLAQDQAWTAVRSAVYAGWWAVVRAKH